jgi:hypothetical protein
MRQLEITIFLGLHNGLAYGIVDPILTVKDFPGIVDIDSQNLEAILRTIL